MTLDPSSAVPEPGAPDSPPPAPLAPEPAAPEHEPATPAAERTPEPSPPSGKAVEYKGEALDAERGPGLGCFWLQTIVLVVVVVLTPLSAAWNWPVPVTILLLALTLVLLLFVGQTVIFLLRIVAADRRAAGRRRPLRSESKTVGEIEDEGAAPAEEDAPRG